MTGWANSLLRIAALVALPLPLIGAALPVEPALDIIVTDLRSEKGVLRICIAPHADAFPDCGDGSGTITRTIDAGWPHLALRSLPPGEYAIAVIHDENANARLDTFAGIPREGFGFSRNPPIRFGPPHFDRARFTVGDAPVRQQVRLRYLL